MHPHHSRTIFLRTLGVVCTTIALFVGISACVSDPAGTAGSKNEAGGTYRIPLPVPEGSVDPVTSSDYGTMLLAGLASANLASLDVAGELTPQLAESWEEAEDQLSWTVTLREGLKFNDGSPLQAEDVTASFERIIADDSLSPGKSSFVGILDHTETVDDTTVRFHLEHPFADFPRLLTGSNTAILPSGYEPGGWIENPVGAGQFTLEEYEVGKVARYKKNPHYWDAEHVLLDEVEVKMYSDPQSITMAFQTGEVDQIESTPEVKAAIDLDEARVQDVGYSQFNGLFMNTEVAPFDDPSVRKAVALAIDRERLIEVAHDGDAEVMNDTVFLPDYPVQPERLTQRTQSPDEVAALLDGRTINFTITTSLAPLGQALQQQLNAIDGFEVELDVMTTGEYFAEGEDTPWLNAPVTLTTWAAGRLPTQFLSLLFGADSEWNASHYTNDALVELGNEFDTTSDPEERQRIANEIGEILHEDVPAIIPEMMLYRTYVGPRVDGDFQAALDYYGGYDLRSISIKE